MDVGRRRLGGVWREVTLSGHPLSDVGRQGFQDRAGVLLGICGQLAQGLNPAQPDCQGGLFQLRKRLGHIRLVAAVRSLGTQQRGKAPEESHHYREEGHAPAEAECLHIRECHAQHHSPPGSAAKK